MKRSNTISIRVRYGETDRMGIVYYANYYTWFEMGRTDLCREWGKPYAEWESEGVLLPVVESQCRYKSPARYDDVVLLTTTVDKLTPYSISFTYEVVQKESGARVAEGWTKHAFASQEGKLIRKNNPVFQWLKAEL